jgi:CheY-like chemotaxis protein/anti-sigma regulatory factor (Ser/Thr protein kinase)
VAREKGLRLHVAPCRGWVRSDFVLLQRIVFNLAANAVRYTRHGSVAIGARRRGDCLRIDVLDSGPGIPVDLQRDIFSEFYQAGPRADRGGLGLGLSIVDRLCRLLGHTVELESSPGRGSRFSIVVPRAAPATASAHADPTQQAAEPDDGRLVLVIDDDPLALDGMRDLLEGWNWEVVTAASADEALSRLSGHGGAPDLIVSDCVLSAGATGIAAVERLRRALDANVPALLISGDTGPDQLQAARDAGLLLLRKPVSPMALRSTLGRLLRSGERRYP